MNMNETLSEIKKLIPNIKIRGGISMNHTNEFYRMLNQTSAGEDYAGYTYSEIKEILKELDRLNVILSSVTDKEEIISVEGERQGLIKALRILGYDSKGGRL